MKEFKTDKSRETYHRVLRSALRLFSQKGYEKTTMRAISKESGLGLGALYYYFPSKEAFVLNFYQQLNDELADEWPEVRPDSPDLEVQIQAFLTFKLQKLEPHRPLMRILLKEAVDPQSALAPLAPGSKTALDKSLSIFQEMVHSERIARMLWLGHLGLIGLWVHKPQLSSKAVAAFAETAPFFCHTIAEATLGSVVDELLEG